MYYNIPTPLTLRTNLPDVVTQSSLLSSDDPAAVFPSTISLNSQQEVSFSMTAKTYTGYSGTCLSAWFSNNTLAAQSCWRVRADTLLVSGTTTAQVDQPMTITFIVKDQQGNTLSQPDEGTLISFVPRPDNFTVSPPGFTFYGSLIRVNSTFNTMTLTFPFPGRFNLVNEYNHSLVYTTFTVLPASGNPPAIYFPFVNARCQAYKLCTIKVAVYDWANVAPHTTTFSSNLQLSTNDPANVILPGSTVAATLSSIYLPVANFTFKQYTGLGPQPTVTVRGSCFYLRDIDFHMH